MREDWEAASESIVAKAEALKKTYGQKEVEAYRMWHALSGSGIRDEAEITHGDFPGEDSVLTFFKTRGKK